MNGKAIAALNAASPDEEAAFEDAQLPSATAEQAERWEASRSRSIQLGMCTADADRRIVLLD
jgi:hypothetical protein